MQQLWRCRCRRVVDLTLPQYYFESREVERQNVKKASVQITSLRYHTYFTTALGGSQYEPHNLEPNWYGNVKIPDEGSFFHISRCRQILKPSHYYTQLFLKHGIRVYWVHATRLFFFDRAIKLQICGDVVVDFLNSHLTKKATKTIIRLTKEYDWLI